MKKLIVILIAVFAVVSGFAAENGNPYKKYTEKLPFTMPESTYFSMNGLYPCDFRNTRVYGVFASSIPEDGNVEETVYPPEDCEKYYLNCDFSGATFFPIDENREILRRFGAIV